MFSMVMTYPAEQSEDTPIKKIMIRPTLRRDVAQMRQNRAYNSIKRGRKIDNEPLVIKVLKNPNRINKPASLTHPKKFDSNIHILPTRANSIYYALAKANGSFRYSPIRTYNSTMVINSKDLQWYPIWPNQVNSM